MLRSIYIANGDKQAIAATFTLAAVLSDVNFMTKEREKAVKRMAYLAARLEGKTPGTDKDSMPE